MRIPQPPALAFAAVVIASILAAHSCTAKPRPQHIAPRFQAISPTLTRCVERFVPLRFEDADELLVILDMLDLAGGREYASFELDVIDANGSTAKTMQTVRGLRTESMQSTRLYLLLKRSAMPNGVYRLSLYGIDGGKRVHVAGYKVGVGVIDPRDVPKPCGGGR